MDLTLAAIIAIALLFDFTNGFHDTANAIATCVSTRAVPPRLAVLGSALLNFAGAFVSIKVAATVANGIVHGHAITLEVVLAGLVGAIAWNLITWYGGIPSSSSHALIGGLIGSAVAATGGFAVVDVRGVIDKVVLPALASPGLTVPLAALLTLAILLVVRGRAPGGVNRIFRKLQIFSAGFVSFAHGTGDAQKTMGIITLSLLISGHLSTTHFFVPTWVIVAAAMSMALGTFAGGWRIIRTLGQRVARIGPVEGFAAETATASVLFTAAQLGFPVSTTHAVSGAIMGAGATRKASAVRWGLAGNIVIAWLITIPCAALVGAAAELITRWPAGNGLATGLVIVLVLVALWARNRDARVARRHSTP